MADLGLFSYLNFFPVYDTYYFKKTESLGTVKNIVDLLEYHLGEELKKGIYSKIQKLDKKQVNDLKGHIQEFYHSQEKELQKSKSKIIGSYVETDITSLGMNLINEGDEYKVNLSDDIYLSLLHFPAIALTDASSQRDVICFEGLFEFCAIFRDLLKSETIITIPRNDYFQSPYEHKIKELSDHYFHNSKWYEMFFKHFKYKYSITAKDQYYMFLNKFFRYFVTTEEKGFFCIADKIISFEFITQFYQDVIKSIISKDFQKSTVQTSDTKLFLPEIYDISVADIINFRKYNKEYHEWRESVSILSARLSNLAESSTKKGEIFSSKVIKELIYDEFQPKIDSLCSSLRKSSYKGYLNKAGISFSIGILVSLSFSSDPLTAIESGLSVEILDFLLSKLFQLRKRNRNKLISKFYCLFNPHLVEKK